VSGGFSTETDDDVRLFFGAVEWLQRWKFSEDSDAC
jgi:hypothetical protein